MDRQHTFVATIDIKSFWEKSKPLLMKVDSDFEEYSVTIVSFLNSHCISTLKVCPYACRYVDTY